MLKADELGEGIGSADSVGDVVRVLERNQGLPFKVNKLCSSSQFF
jgi:hypothetical protein